uniref:BTB domain-containing protein n=1 Tax=Panagrolaimus sp. ES5 TaxID=591445 RepID=A0AC34F6F2_9BILA
MSFVSVEDTPKLYTAKKEYTIDKEFFINRNSFTSKYETVEGMPNVGWQFDTHKKRVSRAERQCQWGMHLIVKTDVDIECEVSFEIGSVIKHFSDYISTSAGSQRIGTDEFILHDELFSMKPKLFHNNKVTLTVKATFCYTCQEDQRAYELVPMIQAHDWFQNLGEKDFKFTVGNESVEIHKFFLTAQSPVFEAMLKHENLKETQTGEIKIIDFKFATVNAFFEFCYGKDIADFMRSTENAIELLMFADKYDMKNLKVSFAEYYSKKLTKENVMDIYKVVRETNAPKLEEVCYNFINSFSRKKRREILNGFPDISRLFI